MSLPIFLPLLSHLQFANANLEPHSKSASAEVRQHQKGLMKHQAVLSMDMDTWEEIIAAWELKEKEPMIPHRKEEGPREMGGRGWFT